MPTRPFQCVLPSEDVLAAKRQYHSTLLRSTLMILVEVCRADVELPPGFEDVVEALLAWPHRDTRFDGSLRTLTNYAENRTVFRGPELALTLDVADDLIRETGAELDALEDPSLRVRIGAIAREVDRATRAVEHAQRDEHERVLLRLREGLATGHRVFHFLASHRPALDFARTRLADDGWDVVENRYDDRVVVHFRRREAEPARPVLSFTPPERPIALLDRLARDHANLVVYVTSGLAMITGFALAELLDLIMK